LKGLEIGTLHLERNEDSGEEELAYVPGRPDEDPLFRCLRGEMEGRLTGAIQNLPERERLVMTLYYYEEMTMREIGMALGVVESRVSQIHASAVLHLRSALSDLSSRGGPSLPRARPGSAKTPGRTERIARMERIDQTDRTDQMGRTERMDRTALHESAAPETRPGS
jgi:RNA polymerase sigma factor for flagellar operon FliA